MSDGKTVITFGSPLEPSSETSEMFGDILKDLYKEW
jgi:hypothetical protein